MAEEKKTNEYNGPKQLRLVILLMLGVILLISGVLWWYISSLREAVYETQITNMEELAEHDIKTIQNFLDDYWTTLQDVSSKAALRDLWSDEEIVMYLRQEQIQTVMEDLYLIDDKGNLYSTTGVYQVNTSLLDRYYLPYPQVMNRNDVMSDGEQSSEDTIYGGRNLNGITIGGHHMVEVIGKCDLNKIQDRIRITNYGGQGYPSVFDENGMMIMGINASGQHITNYFTFLADSTNQGYEGTEKIKGSIAREETFTARIQEKYSKEIYEISFMPIEGTNWYFLISVPKHVFDEQNQKMLSLTLTMVLIILGATIGLLALLFHSRVLQARQAEKEKQRRALEDALDRAESANQAKTAFLFNMSHDIRTPMNAVIGLSDLAQRNENDPEKLRYYMSQISVAGRQLLAIINNILEISRIESNKVEIQEEVTDLDEVLDGLKTVYENQPQAKKLKINFHSHVEHQYLYMDRTHVEEVLVNLVSNAVKYTLEGGTVDVNITEQVGADDEHIILRSVIKDNGIGMSEEFQRKLFNRFERERTSTVSGIQGTGLGLSIVKRLVDLMHGTITVDSKQGLGTAFTVELPLRIGEGELLEENAGCEVNEAAFAGKHVLLAEDIDINAMIAEELLKTYGITMDRANDGEECVRMLEEAPLGTYDLILMDIQMPKLDGFGATKAIRELADRKKAEIPIVAMTANAFLEDKLKAIESGMNGHVGKPIDVNQLLNALQGVAEHGYYYMDNADLDDFARRYALEGCRQGYLVYRDNAEETILYADEGVASLFGCESVKEFLEYTNHSFRSVVHPDDLDVIEDTITRQQFESPKHIDKVTYRMIRKDGAVRKVKDIGFKTYNGTEMLFYVRIADVTEMKV